MAQNKHALARYHIIDSLLRKNESVKTSLMAECCREQTGLQICRRMIQLDIDAMRFDPFLGYYAPIAYDSRSKAYYYTDPDYRLLPFRFTTSEATAMETVREFIRGKIEQECFLIFCTLTAKIGWMIEKSE